MKIVEAASPTDGGTVEVAARDVDSTKVSEHGYFLGVRDVRGGGAFVELTQEEAAEVAAALTRRVG